MYKSILLPIDLGHASSWEHALPVAVSLAKANGAKLHVFTTIPDFGMPIVGSYFPADYEKKALAEAEKRLEEFVAENIPAEIETTIRARHGSIYKEILRAAEVHHCDLIVLASHRPTNKDYLLGPNAARVARHAPQSVFIVRG